MSNTTMPNAQCPMPIKSFAFNSENLAKAEKTIAKYPEGRQQSAVMPLLDLAQRQNDGWLPQPAMDAIADMLNMPPIKVYEVASFYTMYNLKPIGKHHIQVCTTTPCWLRGSGDVLDTCKSKLGIKPGQTTDDGQFTLSEVECLGACVNAPATWIGDDYFEDLDADSMTTILENLKEGKNIKPGPQIDRQTSAPVGGPTTLKAAKAK